MRILPIALLALSLGACALDDAGAAAGGPWPAEVRTETGALRGAIADGVLSFKGIPFAKPPVSNLRWRAPQPADKWQGVREASQYGPDCMQVPFPSDAAPLGVTPAEDCLYANVWRPAGEGKNLPVMVWFYGGGYVNGGSSPAVYDGSTFAKKGVVLVSFNYRLGRFGFFAHPALTQETPDEVHGNYGFADQVAALKWVQRNAAAFGGDPNNVTIFGESAGGGSVAVMLTSPLAKDLFDKAIIQSGAIGLRPISGTGGAEAMGVEYAQSLGIAGQDAAGLAALRALPAATVAEGIGLGSFGRNSKGSPGPMLDGRLIVEDPWDTMRAGRQAKVPVMAGATSLDIGFGAAATKEALFQSFGPDAEKAKAAYDPGGNLELRAAIQAVFADRFMVEPARRFAELATAAGQKAYHYRFSYVAESLRKTTPGAPHATEIPFVFDTVTAKYGAALTPADKAAAEAANDYWVAFAKTGNPNAPGRPQWPAFNGSAGAMMDFTNDGPKASPDPWEARLDVVAAQVERDRKAAKPN
jgi:para-nitrobenzyl esterase